MTLVPENKATAVAGESRLRFAGKVAIVTGAGSGIGLACAARLAAEGAKVLAADLVPGEGGEGIVPVAADVSRSDDWARLAGMARAMGGLDILVNNAARMVSGPPVHVATAEPGRDPRYAGGQFRGRMDGIRRCLPLMEARGGAVVNVASRAAEAGTPQAAAYAASKAALVSLTRSLAVHGAGSSARASLQRGSAGLGRNADVAADLGRGCRRSLRAGPAWPHRPGGRDCLGRAVPGLGRGKLHHRHDADRGRGAVVQVSLRRAASVPFRRSGPDLPAPCRRRGDARAFRGPSGVLDAAVCAGFAYSNDRASRVEREISKKR